MFCQRCGASIDPNDSNCPRCGASIVIAPQPGYSQNKAQQGAQSPQQGAQPQQPPQYQQAPQPHQPQQYGQQPYQQAVPVVLVQQSNYRSPYSPDQVNSHSVLAWVSLVVSIFSCNLLGMIFSIIAVSSATKVRTRLLAGNLIGAEKAGASALLWGWISVGLTVVWGLLMVLSEAAKNIK